MVQCSAAVINFVVVCYAKQSQMLQPFFLKMDELNILIVEW